MSSPWQTSSSSLVAASRHQRGALTMLKGFLAAWVPSTPGPLPAGDGVVPPQHCPPSAPTPHPAQGPWPSLGGGHPW